MAHDGIVGRMVQRQQPALAIIGSGFGRGPFQRLLRQAGQFGFIFRMQAPGVRGILYVVLE